MPAEPIRAGIAGSHSDLIPGPALSPAQPLSKCPQTGQPAINAKQRLLAVSFAKLIAPGSTHRCNKSTSSASVCGPSTELDRRPTSIRSLRRRIHACFYWAQLSICEAGLPNLLSREGRCEDREKARRDGRDNEVQISTHDHPAGCGHPTLKGPGGAEMPAAAILAIEHREPLFAGMGDDDSKTLAGTGRSRRFRLWHLFGCGATDGRLGQIA